MTESRRKSMTSIACPLSLSDRQRRAPAPSEYARPSRSRGLGVGAHGAELPVALLDQVAGRQLGQLLEVALHRGAQVRRGQRRIAVSAAVGLGDDLVDDAETHQV